MRLVFTARGWEDYRHWQDADLAMLGRLNTLVDATLRGPFQGIGKPEQLRHTLPGAWSRRTNDEHRLVYRVMADDLVILQARYHYG